MLEEFTMRSLGIRVTDSLYARIKATTEQEHRSMANWIVVAIEEKLAEVEEQRRGQRRKDR
jgi:predicted DNA-binding protein